jgi:hypothetical protein
LIFKYFIYKERNPIKMSEQFTQFTSKAKTVKTVDKEHYYNFCRTLWLEIVEARMKEAEEAYTSRQPQGKDETIESFNERTVKACKKYRNTHLDCGKDVVVCKDSCRYSLTCEERRKDMYKSMGDYAKITVESRRKPKHQVLASAAPTKSVVSNPFDLLDEDEE